MNNQKYEYNENGRVVIPDNKEISKLPSDGGELWNRLIFEKSPYLLQHAANPIDWYPWGKEAFDLAKQLNRPVFLSIGYTTCHWCHVMEHESFEDDEVAKLMNKTFINVKVDREERPDIDNVYMQVTQMLTGRGGWPMTVIMTPDKDPFFAGTYFPKKTHSNRIGMIELIPKIDSVWKGDRDSLIIQSKKITAQLQKSEESVSSSEVIRADILESTFNLFKQKYDKGYGGFGRAPKFPKPHDYSFLARYYLKHKDADAIEMIENSLYKMRYGGIYDQIGFGFHRYSVDKKWLVPHFEKMLYDQAMLMHAYLDAYIVTKNLFYLDVVNEIAEYVMRDMMSDSGAFFSAEDADSQGEEGLFYIWDANELKQSLDSSEYVFIKDILTIKDNGNCKLEGHRTNIPHINASAFKTLIDDSDKMAYYHSIRQKIYNNRKLRVHPQKDDKILTDWNGLMISALSRAAAITDNSEYKTVAVKSMDFILNKLKNGDNRLFKRYRAGESSINGMIEDYSFMIWALIELYHLTFDVNYLKEAIKLSDYQLNNFWDSSKKGFFFYDEHSEDLIVRSKEVYDGAIPSGNSVSAYNFLRLGKILDNQEYKKIGIETINAFGSKINQYGAGYTMMLHAIDYDLGPSYEVIIVGDPEKPDTKAMLHEVYNSKNLNKIVILLDPKQKDEIIELIPFSKFYFNSSSNGSMAYICKNYTCDLPTNNLEEIKKKLEVTIK